MSSRLRVVTKAALRGASPTRRRSLSIAVAGALLHAWRPSIGQSVPRRPRVAVVVEETLATSSMIGPVRRGLEDLGYIDGKTISLVVRSAQDNLGLLPGIIQELVDERVDVIVAGPLAAQAALKVASPVPVVLVADDPVAVGLASTLAKPGGNFTGMTASTGSDLVAKQMQLLREAVPKARRVAVLDFKYVDSTRTPGTHARRLAADAAARELGLLITHVGANTFEDLSNAFELIASAQPDMLVNNAPFVAERGMEKVVAFEMRMRLPTICAGEWVVDRGSLMSYGADDADLWRRLAVYVHKILQGAKAGDLPFEQPTKFRLVINRKTAKAIGLDIPKALLLRAERIID
jgi:ABC-type uncharacterized transport system substrate-binding protein